MMPCLFLLFVVPLTTGKRIEGPPGVSPLEAVATQAQELAKPKLSKGAQGDVCNCGYKNHTEQDCCADGLVCSSDGPNEFYRCKLGLGETCKATSDCASHIYHRTVECQELVNGPGLFECCIPAVGFQVLPSTKELKKHMPVGETARYCCGQSLDDATARDDPEYSDGTIVCA
mmetsp:Transcript_131115/g.184902  ORF Transcript_131115/g.184902 Transcript_131115/m.184902 type:complete len:173 (+) Transcript_131115:72-590(+)|eukprot:symbB.v1.2.028550.t1/scaffold3037.1/size102045/3